MITTARQWLGFVFTTPPHLRPVDLWRLRVERGGEAQPVLAPAEVSVAVLWYLDDLLLDAAEFQDREAAITWAAAVRAMLTARLSS